MRTPYCADQRRGASITPTPTGTNSSDRWREQRVGRRRRPARARRPVQRGQQQQQAEHRAGQAAARPAAPAPRRPTGTAAGRRGPSALASCRRPRPQRPGYSRPGLKTPVGSKAFFSSRWMRSSGGVSGAKAPADLSLRAEQRRVAAGRARPPRAPAAPARRCTASAARRPIRRAARRAGRSGGAVGGTDSRHSARAAVDRRARAGEELVVLVAQAVPERRGVGRLDQLAAQPGDGRLHRGARAAQAHAAACRPTRRWR